MFLYIVVSQNTLSAALVKEDNKIQKPIYLVNHTLIGVETRYTLIEKFALTVVIVARRLRPYFDAHPIIVLINMPLDKAL